MRNEDKKIENKEKNVKIELIKMKSIENNDITVGYVEIKGIRYIPDFVISYFLLKEITTLRYTQKITRMREFMRPYLTTDKYRQTFLIGEDYLISTKKQLSDKKYQKKLRDVNERINEIKMKDDELIDYSYLKALENERSNYEACVDEYKHLTVDEELFEKIKSMRMELARLNGIELPTETGRGKGRGLQRVLLYNEKGLRKYFSYMRFDNVRLSKNDYAKMSKSDKWGHKRRNDFHNFTRVEEFYKIMFNKEINYTEYFFCLVSQAMKINKLIKEYSEKLFNEFKKMISYDEDLKRKYFMVTKESMQINFRDYAERVFLKNEKLSYLTVPYKNYRAFKGFIKELDELIEKKQEKRVLDIFENVNTVAQGSRLELKYFEKQLEQEIFNNDELKLNNTIIQDYREQYKTFKEMDFFKGSLRYRKEQLKLFNEMFVKANIEGVVDVERLYSKIELFEMFNKRLNRISDISVETYFLLNDMLQNHKITKEQIGMGYYTYCKLKYSTLEQRKELTKEINYWIVDKVEKLKGMEYADKYFELKKKSQKLQDKFIVEKKKCEEFVAKRKNDLIGKFTELDYTVKTLNDYIKNEIITKNYVEQDLLENERIAKEFQEIDTFFEDLWKDGGIKSSNNSTSLDDLSLENIVEANRRRRNGGRYL
jgi:hypothetical protein